MKSILTTADCLEKEEQQHARRRSEEERASTKSIAKQTSANGTEERPQIEKSIDEKLLNRIRD